VEQQQELRPAMQRAFDGSGPVVVDVVVNPDAYHEQIISLRG
jgi:thiamine pyrophosphate-dependent acetolactate synthase large subunit-like protein